MILNSMPSNIRRDSIGLLLEEDDPKGKVYGTAAATLRPTCGGVPSPAYTAESMATDLDGPDRVVVIAPDHIEVWK